MPSMFSLYISVMSIPKAIKILRQCEAELKELLREAASSGDYDCLLRATEWAKQVSTIVGQTSTPPAKASGPSSSAAESGAASPNPPPGKSKDHVATHSPARAKPKRRASAKKRKRTKKAYPKFARLGDELVKIGWSRKDKREYQHKSPYVVAELLASRFAQLSPGGDLVTTDALFPLIEPDGTEVPSYQAYLCLAWLRHIGLVLQDGRRGYCVPDAAQLRAALAKGWKELPRVSTQRPR